MDMNKVNKKFKELVMEYIDGVISDSGKELLFKQAEESADCKKYLENMRKIKLYTGMIRIEPSEYLETRIMAAVNEAARVKENAPGFSRVFAYAASFASVLALSIFIAYGTLNNGGKADLATVTNAPDIKAEKAVQQAKPAVVAEKPAAVKAEIAAVKEAPVAAYEPKVTDYEKENLEKMARMEAVKQQANKPVVSEVAQSPSYIIAKDETPVPTVTNDLLERDRAIVGNNLVNPTAGQSAIIKIKVDETVRVRVIVYDKRIREVITLIDEDKAPGYYQTFWAGRNSNNEIVSDGIYHVFIQIGKRVVKKQIVIAR